MAFINKNFCKTLSSAINSSTYTKLSAQECSEAILYIPSATATDYVDVLDPNSNIPFRLLANKEFTFRGLTDSSQLSAKGSGSLTLCYRTQYFGSMTDL
jgi:hypothetical protein